ncbi:MAG: hypothetical protein Q9180_009573 [Flavoplaca navasiana]
MDDARQNSINEDDGGSPMSFIYYDPIRLDVPPPDVPSEMPNEGSDTAAVLGSLEIPDAKEPSEISHAEEPSESPHAEEPSENPHTKELSEISRAREPSESPHTKEPSEIAHTKEPPPSYSEAL